MKVLMIDSEPWRIEAMRQIFKHELADVSFESLVVENPDIIIWNTQMFTCNERRVILFPFSTIFDGANIIENIKKIFDKE